MDRIFIEGGKPLKGKITLSGAKNAALPIIFSTILCPGWNRLSNVPNLRDINSSAQMLTHLGATVRTGKQLKIDTSKIKYFDAPYELVKTMRASILVLGPLVARFGKAKVSMPGGCAIGPRPIDLHLKALEQMGAKIEISHGYVEVMAKRLKGASIYFEKVTVTGTENILMAATLADGITTLKNAACEPEVVDLANALIKMGAKITGAGTPTITIEGVEHLTPISYTVITDRIEAGTFMIASAITGGDVTITNCNIRHLDALIEKLKESGVSITPTKEGVKVVGPKRIKSVDIKTAPYPGFPTDMQAQWMTLMTKAIGKSVIIENIFENRLMHVAELKRMGARIEVEGNQAIVYGDTHLSGAQLMATDLRASASLILAGLAADGWTEVSRMYHLDRGYEHIEKKLRKVGAIIKRRKK